jgi:hypothetical protein
MKRHIYKYLLAGMLVLSVGSCKKQLEEQFNSPDVYSKVENLFAGMFTEMLTEHKIFVQDYGEFYWQLNAGMEVPGYAQITNRWITDRYAWFDNFDDLSGVNAFGSNNTLWNGRLNDFYTRTRFWAVLDDELQKLTPEQQLDNKIYYTLATVIKDYTALINVDFYNSIPYSEAFKGFERVFYPKFDDPKEIYLSVMADLKEIYTRLPAEYNAMTELGKGLFARTDVVLSGNIARWQQLINAFRLKYAIRLSGVDEAFSKTELTDILSKPLPTADILQPMFAENAPESNGFWIRGLGENSFASFIPNIIMKRMNRDSALYQPGIDDPRLPVIAAPTKYFDSEWNATRNTRKYLGISYNSDGQKAEHLANSGVAPGAYATTPNSFIQSLRFNVRSKYNYTTYAHNSRFPVYMMSAAEVDLLLAEVALKNLGNTGKTAGEHIKDAIIHSTDYWYARNEESRMSTSFRNKAISLNYFVGPATFGTNRFGEDSALYFHPAKPTAGIVSQYADSIVIRFNTRPGLEDKMELLMQQKYIHLNLVAPFELWAELRRTRHPLLEPLTQKAKVMKPFPERLRYPLSAAQTNPDNYLTVQSQDNFITPIFWVPANKRGVIPYHNNYTYE